jgi:ADP-ribose pyrophosphatase YjhB (NUDIX family)
VTGVVFREDGRVLAIQRSDDGRWVPPGGVLELGETPPDGVTREVLEETGVKVQADQLTGVYKNMRLGVVTLAFRCSVIGGQTHPTSEARKVAWLTVDEATRRHAPAVTSFSTASRAHLRRAEPDGQDANREKRAQPTGREMSGQGWPAVGGWGQIRGRAVGGAAAFVAPSGRKPYGAPSCRARWPR